MKEDLKPCPFCGRPMKIYTCSFIEEGMQVISHDGFEQKICPLYRGVIWYGTVEEAVHVWNMRTELNT